MGRHLYFPVTGLPPGKVIQTTEGGTSGTTAPQALSNLNGVPAGYLGVANGIIQLNQNSKIDGARIPDGYASSYNGPMIEGVTTMVVNTQAQFVITDYDVFATYNLAAISGNVSRQHNIITYTAPGAAGSGGFTLNGKSFPVTVVQSATVQKPTIVTPHNETYTVRGNITITSSAFAIGSGSTTHEGSDWQLATDVNFTNIVDSLTNSSSSKTVWNTTLALDDADYYIRVRYKGAGAYGYSAWSDIVHIQTSLNAIVARPTLNTPTYNETEASISLSGSAFALSSGSDTHQGTDWQLALDSNFDVVIKQTINSTFNKTTKVFYGLSPNATYYLRVRYKGTTSGYSEWSDPISFTTTALPTYNLNKISPISSTIDEGTSATYSVITTNVADGTTLYYTIHGTNITAADFNPQIMSGSVVINSNYGSISLTLTNDNNTEGNESFNLNLRTGSINGPVVAIGPSLTINDTSTSAPPTPTYAVAPSTGATTYTEGSSITFNVTTTNVANGTTLYWSINGTGITAGDFSPSGLTGSLTINNNQATVTRTIAPDDPDNNESFVFNLRTDSVSGTIVASTVNLTITDNVTPSYAVIVKDDLNNITTSRMEGQRFKFYVNTLNVTDGTTLYYSAEGVSGSTLSSLEFNPSTLTGSFVVNSNQGYFTLTPDNNGVSEPDKTFVVYIRTGSVNGSVVTQSEILTIIDSGEAVAEAWLIGADYDSNFNNAVSVTVNESIGFGDGQTICYTNYPTSQPMIVSGNLPSGVNISLDTPPSGPPYSIGMYNFKIFGTPTVTGTFTVTFQVNNLIYNPNGSEPTSKQFTRTFIVVPQTP